MLSKTSVECVSESVTLTLLVAFTLNTTKECGLQTVIMAFL